MLGSKFFEQAIVFALTFVFMIAAVLLWSIPVWLVWNLVVPDVFGLTDITIKQAIELVLLSKLLFCGVEFNKK